MAEKIGSELKEPNVSEISNDLSLQILSTSPNVDKIRSLLLQGATPNPGQRSKMWRILLLGSSEALPKADDLWCNGHKALGSLSSNEEHVLSMDVPRTRGEIPLFKEKETQLSVQNLLTRWCLSHGTRYRQGLNEVLAPFIALEEEGGNSENGKMIKINERESYSLFDAFVCRYLAAFYIDGNSNTNGSNSNVSTTDQSASSPLTAFSPEKTPSNNNTSSSTISSAISSFSVPKVAIVGGNNKADKTTEEVSSPSSSGGGGLRAHTSADMGIPLALRLLDLTIKFHDPQLSHHLEEGFIGPELYAVPWLSTALARSSPLEVCWKLWDILIAIDDPSLLPLLCIELLRSERTSILRREPQDVLEVISKLGLNTLKVVDVIRVNALESYALTPRGLRRPLRSVCCYINVGDEDAHDGEFGGGFDDDFYLDDEFDYIAEEVEEVAAAVVAAARMPMNKAVDMLSKLDNAFSAAFSPQPDEDHTERVAVDFQEEEGGGMMITKEQDDDDDEEEEEVSLSIHKPKTEQILSPTKEVKKRGSFSSLKNSLITPVKKKSPPAATTLTSPVALTSPPPAKTKKTATKSSMMESNPSDSFKSPPPKTKLTRSSSSSSSSNQQLNNHQIQAWSPRRISELCNAGIFILSPNELVGSLLTKKRQSRKSTSSSSSQSQSSSGSDTGDKGPTEMMTPMMEDGLLSWLVLDIRPKESSSETRALATSLQLPLEVLNTKKALDIWLQHFDSVKGAPVCILDSNFHMSLNKGGFWKKLGLGSSSMSRQMINNDGTTTSTSGGGGGGVGSKSADTGGLISPQAKWLADVLVNELGFPLVSVFGGSFTDLVEEVKRQQAGHLEPLIIDLAAGSVAGKGPISPMPLKGNNSGNSGNSSSQSKSNEMNKMNEVKQKKLLVALQEAEARGHDTVAKLLRRQLDDCTTVPTNQVQTTQPLVQTTLTTSNSSVGSDGMKKSFRVSPSSLSSSSSMGSEGRGSRNVVVGALPRPMRSNKEQTALTFAEELGHNAIASTLRETTSTPKKTNSLFRRGSGGSFLEKGKGSTSSGGSGWVEVEETEEEARERSQSIGMTSSVKPSLLNTLGAVRSFVNRADEWVEKHMESLLEDTPTKPERLNRRSTVGGGEEEEDAWTEVDVPMNPDIAETLKTIQAAMNRKE